MALFADQLLQMYPSLSWPVLDATGLEGGWDFSVTFNTLPPEILNRLARVSAAPQQDGAPAAPEPIGVGNTIFEAVEKQLGLKLKPEKRPEKVIVIDHIDLKPTDN